MPIANGQLPIPKRQEAHLIIEAGSKENRGRVERKGSRLRGASHPVVIRPAAAFWRNPRDDLVRIGDVAGLAVHAVARI
jgi:hypothetical protein